MNRTAIKPTGLKGKEQMDRIVELMNQTLIKENVDRSVIELTKLGPDGRVYGIVRENHEYYIKIAENSNNLTKESFDYIGGLKNKKSFVYPSYAKAIKQLNLKFMSLCESLGIKSDANMFINDKLVSEHHPYKSNQKLSATKGMGDSQEYVVDKSGKELSFTNKEGKAEDGFGDNVADKDFMDEFEDVKLTKNESRINAILTGVSEDVVINEGNIIVKQPLSLLSTLERLDEVVSVVTGEKKKQKLSEAEGILQSLSKEEIMSILEKMTVKKKL
jgi:hypothetical protein